MRFISYHDGKLQVLNPQEFRAPTAEAFTTGLSALDALAPGGAFARGAVHEILTAPEHGAALFFATLLAKASAAPSGESEARDSWMSRGVLAPTLQAEDHPADPGNDSTCRVGVLAHRSLGGQEVGEYTHPTFSSANAEFSPSPGTPGEGWGGGRVSHPNPRSEYQERGKENAPKVSRTQRFICWCDPTREIYPPALASHGIALTHLFLLHPNNPRDLLWAISESLRCKGVAAVVAAPPRLSRIMARRLQLSAERGGGVGLLLRHTNAPGIDCYAAATRWLVRPHPGERTVQRWNVQLIHGHGGCIGKTVILEVSRENHSVRALESLAHRPLEKSEGKTPRVARAS